MVYFSSKNQCIVILANLLFSTCMNLLLYIQIIYMYILLYDFHAGSWLHSCAPFTGLLDTQIDGNLLIHILEAFESQTL